jgi:hypothetical protein
VGSIERRIQQLEGLYQASPGSDSGAAEEREMRRGAFLEMLQGAREKAAREEAEGYPQRRIALDNLLESMRRRREADG